ncbi:MAG: SAM-dependent DNA methyltransferase [Acholeplasmatales bacterium]|nr:SAM-dependent DNA methyltransferase [Acholeplasmatales bacterium]
MTIDKLQKQTNINIQEKANLIWEIATHLYGEYKPHEYGKVILPMTVIKRFDDALKDTKKAVVEKNNELNSSNKEVNDKTRHAILKNVAKHDFYNTSKFDFAELIADADNIKENFTSYLQSFSDNVKDIIQRFDFFKEIDKMSENDLLYTIINEFNAKKADFSPNVVTAQDMGYIFEELIRKFSESYDEQAGAHFTARDIIYLMTELLVVNAKDELKKNGGSKTAYDMTMGTSQMLTCLDERLQDINESINLTCFGQEFNPETYAIAKADTLIRGGDADNMKFGDTLSNDQFEGYTFDYIISNPPFGIDWKKEKDSVEKEAKLGESGRFEAGLPAIGDGQMLFLQNGLKKLKPTGRMAIIQNGSSLFNGDAGSGPSNIRKYIIENDRLEAIIQLPNDLFYNTGIATYIWVVTGKEGKENRRLGKVQLIDASKCYVKRRKNIGNKRVDLSDEAISLIVKAYNSFDNLEFNEDGLFVESKVFDNTYFGYTKVTVETAETVDKGNEILKKGKKQAVKGKTDSEIIPLTEDIEKYFNKNVLPFNEHAFMDRTKDKAGYEIPFTRIFYKFVEPRKSDDIFAEFKELSNQEQDLMKKILGE